MSQKYPIIAITGSSGAGTTTVTSTFDRSSAARGLPRWLSRVISFTVTIGSRCVP